MVVAERLAEVFRQLAFISAVLGGFSVTFWVALLTAEARAASVAAGFAVAASVSLLVVAMFMTISAVQVTLDAREAYDALPPAIAATYEPMTFLFLFGALLFFVALGISGFVRSRRMGIASSILGGLGVLSLGVIVALF